MLLGAVESDTRVTAIDEILCPLVFKKGNCVENYINKGMKPLFYLALYFRIYLGRVSGATRR